jgi:hypothetical protein
MAENIAVDAGPKDDLGFDPKALLARYRAERDKRLRPDSLDQFVPTKGEFLHYREDRYVQSGFTRTPLTDEVEIAVIGGGFCGLLLGAQLRQAGVEGIRFIDRAGDFGGTWYWNRYPGAACDTESYIYLPLLEELGYIAFAERFMQCRAAAHSSSTLRLKRRMRRPHCIYPELRYPARPCAAFGFSRLAWRSVNSAPGRWSSLSPYGFR